MKTEQLVQKLFIIHITFTNFIDRLDEKVVCVLNNRSYLNCKKCWSHTIPQTFQIRNIETRREIKIGRKYIVKNLYQILLHKIYNVLLCCPTPDRQLHQLLKSMRPFDLLGFFLSVCRRIFFLVSISSFSVRTWSYHFNFFSSLQWMFM